MKWEKLMEALVKASENKFTSGADKVQTGKLIAGAMQSYFNPPGLNGLLKAKMQASAYEGSLGVSSDIQEVGKFTYNFMMETAEYDNLWEQAFKKVTLLGGQRSWEIHTGTSGIAFGIIAEGQRLRVDSVKTAVTTANIFKYGGAIAVTDEMLRFRLVAELMDMVGNARDKYLIGKSNIFYALMVAAGAGNVTSWQASSDGELRRDVLTWNAGLASIGNRMKDKDPNASKAPILLYANPDDEGRIEAIVKARTVDQAGALGGAREVVGRPVRRLYTYNIAQGSPLFVWPGRKNQWAQALDLTQLTDTDIMAYLYLQAYWSYFGGKCADTDQFQTLTLGS